MGKKVRRVSADPEPDVITPQDSASQVGGSSRVSRPAEKKARIGKGGKDAFKPVPVCGECGRCRTKEGVNAYKQPSITSRNPGDVDEETQASKKGRPPNKSSHVVAAEVFSCTKCWKGYIQGGNPFLGTSYQDWCFVGSQSEQEYASQEKGCDIAGGEYEADYEPEDIRTGERFTAVATVKMSFIKAGDWDSLKTTATLQNSRVEQEKAWTPLGENRFGFFVRDVIDQAEQSATQNGGTVDAIDMEVKYEKYFDRGTVHLKAGSATRATQADEIAKVALKKLKGSLPPSMRSEARPPSVKNIKDGVQALQRSAGASRLEGQHLTSSSLVEHNANSVRAGSVSFQVPDSAVTLVRKASKEDVNDEAAEGSPRSRDGSNPPGVKGGSGVGDRAATHSRDQDGRGSQVAPSAVISPARSTVAPKQLSHKDRTKMKGDAELEMERLRELSTLAPHADILLCMPGIGDLTYNVKRCSVFSEPAARRKGILVQEIEQCENCTIGILQGKSKPDRQIALRPLCPPQFIWPHAHAHKLIAMDLDDCDEPAVVAKALHLQVTGNQKFNPLVPVLGHVVFPSTLAMMQSFSKLLCNNVIARLISKSTEDVQVVVDTCDAVLNLFDAPEPAEEEQDETLLSETVKTCEAGMHAIGWLFNPTPERVGSPDAPRQDIIRFFTTKQETPWDVVIDAITTSLVAKPLLDDFKKKAYTSIQEAPKLKKAIDVVSDDACKCPQLLEHLDGLAAMVERLRMFEATPIIEKLCERSDVVIKTLGAELEESHSSADLLSRSKALEKSLRSVSKVFLRTDYEKHKGRYEQLVAAVVKLVEGVQQHVDDRGVITAITCFSDDPYDKAKLDAAAATLVGGRTKFAGPSQVVVITTALLTITKVLNDKNAWAAPQYKNEEERSNRLGDLKNMFWLCTNVIADASVLAAEDMRLAAFDAEYTGLVLDAHLHVSKMMDSEPTEHITPSIALEMGSAYVMARDALGCLPQHITAAGEKLKDISSLDDIKARMEAPKPLVDILEKNVEEWRGEYLEQVLRPVVDATEQGAAIAGGMKSGESWKAEASLEEDSNIEVVLEGFAATMQSRKNKGAHKTMTDRLKRLEHAKKQAAKFLSLRVTPPAHWEHLV